MGSIEMIKKYSLLKDLKFEVKINEEDESERRGFSISFWLYISCFSSSFPSVILYQVDDKACNVPFLGLSDKKKLMLFPLRFLHPEAPSPGDSVSWIENTCASSKTEFPLKKWVHVGCEVSINSVRLYTNGVLVEEKPLSSTSEKGSHINGPRTVLLLSSTHGEIKVDYEIQGYVYGVEVLSRASAVKDHYLKDPPLQLSIDESSALDIDEGNDGVWNIVGGKASCRRNFSIDVILLNAVGQPVNKDLEVVASLLYAENKTPVEKPNDAEAPLLTSYDGIEFASWDRPSKLMNGRAFFKLKISQLSSKCDNRLFCISFDIPELAKYPFFKTLTHRIRCISRNRNPHASSFMWKQQTSPMHLLNGSQSFGMDEESSDIHNTVCEEKQSPSSKRVKLAQEKRPAAFRFGISSEQVNKECNPPAWISNKDNTAYETSLRKIQEIHVEAEHCSSGSESNEATMSNSRSMSSCINPVSDSIVFKYCLEGPSERSRMLREIAMLASEQELMDFANQVSLYSGCFHHRHQIIMSKKLIEDGNKAWNLVSEKNKQVLWEILAPEIEEQFKKISCCSTRYLSLEDLELLRKIAGCQDLVTRENFERLWCWLYPVAFTLSQEWIQAIWDSVLPKWIEGLITKEEAEASLQGNGRFQDPGTFVLRFPTSRSWPHPDAGNLVVTYVGCDYSIHHKLLSLDLIYSSSAKETNVKPLKEMLLEEPELSRLGRIRRNF